VTGSLKDEKAKWPSWAEKQQGMCVEASLPFVSNLGAFLNVIV
jgi:hypothetical protein